MDAALATDMAPLRVDAAVADGSSMDAAADMFTPDLGTSIADLGVDMSADASEDLGVDMFIPTSDLGMDMATSIADASTSDMSMMVADMGVDMFVPPIDMGVDMFIAPVDMGVDMFVPPVDMGVDMFVAPVDMGVDMFVAPVDMGTGTLAPDCTHRWLIQASPTSNLKVLSVPNGVVVAGFPASGGGSLNATFYDALDGHVVWSDLGYGAWSASTNGAQMILQNGSGGGNSYGVMNPATGVAMVGFVDNFATSGFSSVPPIVVAPSGESVTTTGIESASIYNSMTMMYVPTPTWMASFSSTPESGMTPEHFLVHRDPVGHLEEIYTNSEFIFSGAGAMPDGRWTVVAQNESGADATLGGTVFHAGDFALVMLDNHLTVQTALPVVASSILSTWVVPSASGIRTVERFSTSLQGFDDSGVIWTRGDCATNLATYAAGSVRTIGDDVYVAANIFSSTHTWCGATFAPGSSGFAVAVLDARTGATLSVRWLPSPFFASQVAVSPDGDTYFGVNQPAMMDYTVCGSTVTGASTSVTAVLAL